MVAERLRKKAGENIKVQNFLTVQDKLEELEDIGLSMDQKYLLMFTSLMGKEMNNLIISNSKFLDWFEIDFSDETQEEADFMQNRYEAWFLALKAAKIIVAETSLNPNCPLEDYEWW